MERELGIRRNKEKIQEKHQEIEKDYTEKFKSVEGAKESKDFNDEWKNRGDHS